LRGAHSVILRGCTYAARDHSVVTSVGRRSISVVSLGKLWVLFQDRSSREHNNTRVCRGNSVALRPLCLFVWI